MKKYLFSLFILFSMCAAWGQTVYYVSPLGKEKNNGSIQKPFNNISKAVEKARTESGEITLFLREGIYRLDAPLVFTPLDGADNKHLSIRAFPGENVTLTGGVELKTKWESYRNGIMKTRLEGVAIMDMLIVNGQIRHQARYPNYDEKAVRFNGTSAESTSAERVKTWANPKGGYLHGMHSHDWGDFHYRIIDKDNQGNLKLEGGWQNNRQSELHEENRMIENIFEELDAPGEWYYNSQEQLLYYYPMANEDIHTAQFESPQIKHLIEFRGSELNPVKNITIEGIELTQTVRTFMEQYEPLLRSDWMVYRGGAILLEGTENCVIHHCTIHNLGGNAIFFSQYNRGSKVSGSHIAHIGASAVCFVGDADAVRSPSFEYGEFVSLEKIDRTKGPKSNNYPAYCQVYDNLIHNIGLYEKQTTGVELSMCRNITVSHNSIYHTPRAGLNISEGTWGGHIIEFNDVFDTVRETGDHGSFNSWGRDRFWHPEYSVMEGIVEKEPALILADIVEPVTIRNNRFRCDRGWDIDLDDGSSNYHIYNNLCLNGGIKLREGFYRTVENNIIVNNSFHPHVWFRNSGDVFARNIVMTSYKPIGVNEWGLMVDYNIFTDSVSLKMAQGNLTDIHSIVSPVRFTNASTGDFTVTDDSDAVTKGGFRNFVMDRFGVVSPHLKAMAQIPEMPTPIIISSQADSKIINWHGVNVKSLQTLGERSATGMDSERGVYVVSVDALGSSLRDYVKPNDAIIAIGGKPTNNVEDLLDIVHTIDSSKDIEVTVFRMQKENKILIPADLLRMAR